MAEVKICLDKFVCINQNDSNGDDIYLEYQVDAQNLQHRYPGGQACGEENLELGGSWDVGLFITFSTTLTVS